MTRPFRDRLERWITNSWIAAASQIVVLVTIVIIAPKVEEPANTAAYVGWVGLALVLFGLQVGLPEFRQQVARSKAEALTEMSAEHLAMISGYIDPALDVLRSFTNATDSAALSDLEGTFRSKLLECAQRVCGPRSEDVRALLFTRNGKALRQTLRSGGTKDSVRVFTNNRRDPAGQEAWKLAQKGQPKLYEDVLNKAPEHYESPEEREYQTFITCGILDQQGEVQGMLNIDAREPKSLTSEDKQIVKHLVGLIATGIDVAGAIRPHLN